MTYKLTIKQKPTYLHAIVTGPNCRESVLRYMDEVLNECKARNCFRLLIEERLEGPRMGATDVFILVNEGSKKAFGMFEKIAYVDVNAVDSSMKFGETVAVNRSLPMKVLDNVSDAEKWLLNESSGTETYVSMANSQYPARPQAQQSP